MDPLFNEVYPCTIEVDWNYVPFIYSYITGQTVNDVEELEDRILALDGDQDDSTLDVVKQLLENRRISSVDKVIYIADIEVPEEFRRQGIATEAVKRLSDLARDYGLEYVLCEYASEAGKGLFEHLGYEHFQDGVMGKRI